MQKYLIFFKSLLFQINFFYNSFILLIADTIILKSLSNMDSLPSILTSLLPYVEMIMKEVNAFIFFCKIRISNSLNNTFRVKIYFLLLYSVTDKRKQFDKSFMVSEK